MTTDNRQQFTGDKGFTLIELLVTVFVFTTVIVMSSGVFISAIRLQRKALSSQKLLDEMNFATEYMSRTIRMAKKDRAGNCVAAKQNYEITREEKGLKFLNYKDECQEFFWDSDNQLKESKDGGASLALTSNDFKVLSFTISLLGESQDDNKQPRVSFFLEVEGKGAEKPKIQLQTTISQRNLDIQI